MDERPEFFVPLGAQMCVMRLMRGAVEAEAGKTQDPKDDALYLIPAAVPHEETVGSLVKTNQSPVHEMADEQDEQHCQPDR